MGRIIPTEIKDLFEMTPAGTLQFVVTGAQEAWVGKQNEEVYGIVITHQVVEPSSHAGVEHNETFFIGINESAKQVQQGKLKADPEAANDETWKVRAAGFKRYMEKHGIQIEGADLDVVLQTVVGKQIIGKVAHVASKTAIKDDGTPMMNARVERWFSVGEVEPALAPETAAPVVAANPARPAAPAAGPRPAAAVSHAAPQAVPNSAAPAPQATPPARPVMRRIGK